MRGRTAFVVPAGLAMLLGLDAGLNLLDVWAPVTAGRVGEAHGVLMVWGFVGALVALERAVALRQRWGFAAPVGLSLGALLQVVAATATTGQVLLLIGSATLVALYVPLWRRQRDDAVLVESMGAVLGLGAAILWAGGVDVPALLPWLAGFLILTIAGERLELAKLAMPAHAAPLLLAAAAGLCVAAAASLLWPQSGSVLFGVSLAALAAWLLVHDVARRTVRSTGLTRFMGASMLAGQGWLAVAAAVWLAGGAPTSHAAYDAAVHAVFLGFTMSMVMAHASVILPAVTGLRLTFHPAMWFPLGLLQASLLVRLWLGDGLGLELARQVGGAGNVVALLAFVAVMVFSAVRSRRP